jgi:hypothetical protein
LALPDHAIAPPRTGTSSFEEQYGFRSKPVLVRFRYLDGTGSPLPGFSDLSLPAEDFARLPAPPGRVFILENEIDFLAFPEVPDGLALFGAGYGFGPLRGAAWLREREVFYWGDIDTHGFAILSQFREHLPRARSLLMDRRTLMDHREHWTAEPRPARAELPRLTPEEANLYDDLRRDRIAPSLRLEQERIGYGRVLEALEAIVPLFWRPRAITIDAASGGG